MVYPLNGKTPKIGSGSFVAPNATIIGDVIIGERCTIWYNAVLRGDVFAIRIGNETNVQDGTIIHGTYLKCGTTLGNRVSIGHAVILHGCTVDDGSLIGMGSIIMDHAHIPRHCLVGAGSLVTENAKFEEGMLILGRPAKAVRKLNDEELKALEKSADNYLFYKKWYDTQEGQSVDW
jgi:carbonic anhydrase/acetyltransferase-like protein (isoleucine patch superfamily)